MAGAHKLEKLHVTATAAQAQECVHVWVMTP